MKETKKLNKKLTAVLTLIAAGSIFYTEDPATAKGLELEGIQIIFGRHHDAPPPPQGSRHHHHAFHHRWPRPGPHVPPPHHGGHMPPHHHHYR